MDYLTMSSGSDTLSGSVGCSGGRQSRVRTVRLVRPSGGPGAPAPSLACRHGPGLGFSVRGGREHGTGFFVSSIETGSEAHRQGLRVGDQIIRINGFTVEDAIHKEVIQLISNHTHLTLKVRSVGMIPVKDKCSDPLSWQIIPDYSPIISESPPLEDKTHDVRINIAVAQRAKLGCGICKGPEWKPGIFVQFTKEGGIARDAGLRPGDQIISCNSVDFTDIAFNEAVNIMKTSRQLELVVRKGAGSELFPGESSGYNSSASSVTGDQSPSWSESKRLSIVKEETLELEDRLQHLEGRYKPRNWEKISYEWDECPRHYKPTIINLSENGMTIKNNGVNETAEEEKPKPSTKLADICMVSHQHEMKTVVVEVHRSDKEEQPKTDEVLRKSPSIASFSSLASRSSDASSSLSSAITLELQRRSERMKETEKKVNIEDEIQKKKILKGVDSDKKHQHDKLMDEFKKAHRKMFQASSDENEKESSSIQETVIKEKLAISKEATVTERQMSCQYAQRLRDRRSETDSRSEEVEASVPRPPPASAPVASPPRPNTSAPPPPPPPSYRQSFDNKPKDSKIPVRTDRMPPLAPAPPPAPPAPPAPSGTSTPESKTLPKTSTKPKAPPVPQKTKRPPSPPPCPTPDYDTLSLNSVSSSSTMPRGGRPVNGQHRHGDTVDMESLESYKLNNPANSLPKPPCNYFMRPKTQLSPQTSNSSQGSQTLRRRPVSVTIGEYPSGTTRKQPTKFDFLQNGGHDCDHTDGRDEPITSRLASELAQTLSRSNLRKRTESMENLLNGSGGAKPQNNCSVTISVNNANGKAPNSFFLNNNTHKVLTKAQSVSSAECRPPDLASILSNRVTIKISDAERRTESPNGILKNGNGNHCSAQHKPLVHQKSITFGEITTVINDRPMHVT